jgi:hypothetical protein
MCFSQKASFGAAIVLVGIGALALKEARTSTQRTVALMPMLFAAQQFTEGILWLSLLHQEYGYLKRAAMYSFLTFAELLWPLYVPFITLLVEKDKYRRKLIGFLLSFGLAMVLSLIYGMVAYPVDARLSDGHIFYDLQYPLTGKWYYGLLYFIPTIAAPMLSRNRQFVLLGSALLVSYLVSRVFYNPYVVSIWCYFATLVSLIVVRIVRQLAGEEAESSTSPGIEKRLI